MKKFTFNTIPSALGMIVKLLLEIIVLQKQMLENLPEKIPKVKKYLTLKEASEYLGMPVNSLRIRVRSGTIPAAQPSKKYIIKIDDLEKFMEEQRQKAKLRNDKATSGQSQDLLLSEEESDNYTHGKEGTGKYLLNYEDFYDRFDEGEEGI